MKKLSMLYTFSLGIIVLSSCSQEKQKKHPNILFILSDDHAKSAISAYKGINADSAPTPK